MGIGGGIVNISRNRLGDHTRSILRAMDLMGPMSVREVSEAAGLDVDTTRKYLPRCTSRGLVLREEGTPIRYCLAPGWRQMLLEKPAKPPRTTGAFALQGIWNTRKGGR